MIPKPLLNRNNPKLYILREPPGYLKARYRRLALIITRRQLELLDARDDDTLVISCDWLLFQQEVATGRHILYFEFGLMREDHPVDLGADLVIRANDWFYDENAEDPTIFRNVSLGRTFNTEVSLVIMNHFRLDSALRVLIDRFGPEEIWFFDFSYDINLLNRSLRRMIAETVAHECGVVFVDRSDEAPSGDHEISEPVYTARDRGLFVRFLLSLYSWALLTITRARCVFFRRAPRILILVNTNMAGPLIRNFRGGGFIPLFISRTVPRKVRLLWQCLWQGILLFTPKAVSLSDEDRVRLAEIRKALDKILSKPAQGALGFSRAFVRQQILDTYRFDKAAESVRLAERVLERYCPQHIVLDGVRNSLYRMYIELAHTKGISVDFIWHSPVFPQNKPFDILNGDPRYSVSVSRLLSWGKTNEKWLDKIGAKSPRVRVGCPIEKLYNRPDLRSRNAASTRETAKNVLVLQYTFLIDDLAGLNLNMYEYLVTTIRELRRLGYSNIRFKLHPGPGRWKKIYFENIVDYFGLDCVVMKKEPFHECLEWADIVVGPCQTGALLETLAAGKPYHAFLLAPYTADPTYYGKFPLLSSFDQLADALKIDTSEKARELLNQVYSIDEIPNGAERFWEVLENDFA